MLFPSIRINYVPLNFLRPCCGTSNPYTLTKCIFIRRNMLNWVKKLHLEGWKHKENKHKSPKSFCSFACEAGYVFGLTSFSDHREKIRLLFWSLREGLARLWSCSFYFHLDSPFLVKNSEITWIHVSWQSFSNKLN